MPLWGTPQAGSNADSRLNVTDLQPSDSICLFDGTEAISTGSTSIAFSASIGAADSHTQTAFFISGCGNGTQVTIQGSAGTFPQAFTFANFDASFQSFPSGSFIGNAPYQDVGRAAFYRAKVALFVAGDAPVVLVKR